MPESKEKELVEQLKTRTLAHQLKWEPTAHNDEFVTTFRGKYSARVARLPNEFDDFDFTLILRDDLDREMIALNSRRDLPGGLYRQEMVDLFESARRSALNVEQSIDEILDDLKSLQ